MKLRHLALLLFLTAPSWSQSRSEAIPRVLRGNWRVTGVLPTQTGCWSGDKASRMLNTTITYSGDQIRWDGRAWPITETLSRTLTPAQFRSESSREGGSLQLTALGIHASRVTELDLQHDDVDITDVTTEIPGDTVLLAGPNRILVSVCNTWFEATRNATGRAAPKSPAPRNPVQRTTETTTTHPAPARKSGL